MNINKKKTGNKKKQIREDEIVIKMEREKKGKEMKGHNKYNVTCRKCPVKF